VNFATSLAKLEKKVTLAFIYKRQWGSGRHSPHNYNLQQVLFVVSHPLPCSSVHIRTEESQSQGVLSQATHNNPCIEDNPGIEVAQLWQQSMQAAIRNPVELCRLLGLSGHFAEQAQQADALFPLFAPREYVARMHPGDEADPLLRQAMPLHLETKQIPGFEHDPVGDSLAVQAPGLLQKYRGRVLLITTGVCAVHCRYCFRRHFPYDEAPRSLDHWEPALKQIAADSSIREVLLSGGDPLTLADSRLENLLTNLAKIPHLRRLRIHTRLPIMIPSRITSRLIQLLRQTLLTTWMVIHATHPAELGGDVDKGLARLTDAGIPLLNQAVLLRGVNDDVETLAELCESLIDRRAAPYYLHQLDRVAGAAHFEVSPAEGKRLLGELQKILPGYAVPRYVQEIAGELSKVSI